MIIFSMNQIRPMINNAYQYWFELTNPSKYLSTNNDFWKWLHDEFTITNIIDHEDYNAVDLIEFGDEKLSTFFFLRFSS